MAAHVINATVGTFQITHRLRSSTSTQSNAFTVGSLSLPVPSTVQFHTSCFVTLSNWN